VAARVLARSFLFASSALHRCQSQLSKGYILKKLDAYRVFLILSVLEAFAFSLIFTVNLVYQVDVVKLSPLQLVLVGTALEVTVFFFEIPTGIVADVYSRRLSCTISMFIMGFGFLVEVSTPVFAAVVVGQMLWGLGYTFTSGARNAWLADEIGEEAAAKAYLRGSQVAKVGALVATAISVALATISLILPILLGGALLISLGVFLFLFMPEGGFKPAPRGERSTWAHMGDTFREGTRTIRARPALITIILIIVIYGMYSEGFDRLWTAHLIRSFTLPSLGPLGAVGWFGLIRIVGMLLTIGPAELLHRRLEMNSTRKLAITLMTIDTVLVVVLVTFALAGNFTTAVIAVLIISPLRGLIDPLVIAWINQGIDSSVRATVLSMSEQAGAFGELSGGPILGTIGNLFGLRAALMGSAVLLTGVLPLYARSLALRQSMTPDVLPAALD
jgi:MFS transporter, DHA3 family, tetracycline resistance protein